MLSKFRRVQGEKGFALIELLIIVAIIGILAAIALPQFGAYKNRKYQSAAKSDLRDLHEACKTYWADNAGMETCTAEIVAMTPSDNVTITITDGTEKGFVATAIHAGDETATTYSIDSIGNIS